MKYINHLFISLLTIGGYSKVLSPFGLNSLIISSVYSSLNLFPIVIKYSLSISLSTPVVSLSPLIILNASNN